MPSLTDKCSTTMRIWIFFPLLIGSAWIGAEVAAQRPAGRPAAPPPATPPAPTPAVSPDRSAPAGEADAPEAVAGKYFEQADLDRNGWVLYGEAEKTMRLDKAAFAAFDRDLDFRISREEFIQHYLSITGRGGIFPAPGQADLQIAQPLSQPAAEPQSPSETLLATFDDGGDKAIDEVELRTLLVAKDGRNLDPQVVMTQIDRDSDKRLAKEEIDDLAHLLDPNLPAPIRPKAKSIDELFGKRLPREAREGAIRLPDQIVGPVDSFRRLDLDGNGKVSEAELHDLLRPVQTGVRLGAVFATLDRNSDGWLSPEEFWTGMGG